jgi:hypothetical protein
MAGSGELLRTLLPVDSVAARGRVLALELYDDGLIIRFVVPHKDEFPYAPWDAADFSLQDDVGTSYRFEGLTAGGQPAHGLVTFSPPVPPSARWVEVRAPVGSARFDVS